TDMRALIGRLAEAGYVRDASPESKGMFAVRGDVLDIYPVNCEHPVRIDFFGDEVESIKPYDDVTGERYPLLSRIDIVAATDAVYGEGERERVAAEMRAMAKKASSSAAYSRMTAIATDVESGAPTEFVL